ncbi:MAG: hypothetical protein C4B59_12855 [Candidatus Methanogaster sp.]|uniref:Uncharacterized protein n=1 Tax=Candidatus Methanogaster sp. TaxID=3386292 RepID=A0AC61L0M8_9EURY|nr:MAG: hypothetical protein C4B59_12855 [ANME-2 cluster archaeon]
MKMKSISRKTGMMIAVLALITVMFIPTATAPPPGKEVMTAIWDDSNIVVTVENFLNPGHWYQNRLYQPGTSDTIPPEGPFSPTNMDGYFVLTAFVPSEVGDPYTDRFNVTNSGAGYKGGEWTVCLYKDGVFKEGATEPQDPPKSPRGCETVMVGDDPAIPEFATIAIPTIAMLGLFALYRRKQKK